MRDKVVLFINGQRHTVGAADVFQPLTDYLRSARSLCGTKVVCAEGDCGACTVLVGRAGASEMEYVPVNGCIQYLYQLDGCHVITVEALAPTLSYGSHDELKAALNPAQLAMVENNGAQCGYCTPGFVMSLSALSYCRSACPAGGSGSESCSPEKDVVRDALTGNLCRCTGYEAIVKAGVASLHGSFKPLTELFDEAGIFAELSALDQEEVSVAAGKRQFYLPTTVEKLSRFLDANEAVLVSGGTDLSVNMNKRGFSPAAIVSTARLKGLATIEVIESNDAAGSAGSGKILAIGARVSLAQLEAYMQNLCPQFYKILWVFGSPQIRHAGTLAGNIANGSPIADSLPFLMLMQAEVEASSFRGVRRIKMADFYLGYKKLALAKDEVITRIFLPLPGNQEKIRLYKVSRREHLDISAFTAAISVTLGADGKISAARVVFGGVAATVLKMKEVEDFLQGKPDELDTYRQAGLVAIENLRPLTDVRGSREFRLQLAANIFSKFYFETR
ncbi:MAG TPA: FAD binding domain-containing protein [Candidatus Obscuribacter sp.]|nr:FAD binding domain-containing protein [Candidatus Obscuribacter sp.]HMY54440.1 FAD binding domain-containing protein [Candidatus Obscuribacter sp.]HND06241.1 FAD binding domain-containing protein [Candidatus Obscuribacter sp.]